jgi:hypothetical protein
VLLNFGTAAQFVIERDLPGAGTLSGTQLRERLHEALAAFEISLRSLQTLKAMGPQIQ